MLDLNIDQIKRRLVFTDAVSRITDAYIKASQNEVQTPDVVHLSFNDANGECHVKTGHINGTDSYVIKIASGFYDNPKKGLPSSNGMMLAFSATTGTPMAILRDEGWLTDLRTGIGGALATQSLAKQSAQDVLILGTGLQAMWQAKCLTDLDKNRPFRFVIWGRDHNKAKMLVGELAKQDITATASDDLQHSVRSAQIIITTTPSNDALIKDEWVQPGTHITAIGSDSPGKQELPVDLVRRADLLVCDMAHQSLAHGEFQHAAQADPELKVVELGDVLSGRHAGRSEPDDITIADLTGIAAQDIAITQSVIADTPLKEQS